MKEDQMELDGLIQKVMDQMDESRYGKKKITRYRSGFQLLISVSHDIGENILSERLMKTFLDRPVSCGEKWATKELAHRKRCLRLLLSLTRTGSVDWGRQDTGGVSEKITDRTFRPELECFASSLEQEGVNPNTMSGYKRIVAYFLLFCQKSGYGKLSDIRTNDISTFILPFTGTDGSGRLRSKAAWQGCAGSFPPMPTRRSSSWRYQSICRGK